MTPIALYSRRQAARSSDALSNHAASSPLKLPAGTAGSGTAPAVDAARSLCELVSNSMRPWGFSSLWCGSGGIDSSSTLAAWDPQHAKTEWLEARFSEGHRESELLEVLARRYAAAGNFEKAIEVGLQRRISDFSNSEAKVAFDLELGQWAERNDDLLLAKWIYLRGHDPEMIYYQQGPFVKAPYDQAFFRLHEDPRRWILAARRKMTAGDFLAAESLLLQAERINGYTVYRRKELKPWMNAVVISYPASLGSLKNEKSEDGSWNLVSTKLTSDGDPSILAEIQNIRVELRGFEDGLDDRIAAEVESLRLHLEKSPLSRRDEVEERMQELESFQRDLQGLGRLGSGRQWEAAENHIRRMLDAVDDGQWDTFETEIAELAHPIQKLLGWEDDRAESRREIKAIKIKFLSRLADVLSLSESRDPTVLQSMLEDLKRDFGEWRNRAGEGLQHLEASGLLRKARLHLAAGYFFKRSDLTEAGRRELRALERYVDIEARKSAAFFDLAKLYPEGSSLIFKTVLSEQDKIAGVYDMRPAPKWVDQSRILKTLRRLDSDDPALAATMKAVLSDLRHDLRLKDQREVGKETGLTYELGEEIVGYQEDETFGRDAMALEARTRELERLYGQDNAEIIRFLREVQNDEFREFYQKNTGYRYQWDLASNLARLKDFAINAEAFRVAREGGYREVNAEMAQALTEFLKNGGKLYEKFLEDQVIRARERETMRFGQPSHQWGYIAQRTFDALRYYGASALGASSESILALKQEMLSETERAAQALAKFRAQFSMVKARLDSLDISNLVQTFTVLEEISIQEQGWAELHSLGILKWELEEIQKISSAAKSRVSPLIEQLESKDPWSGTLDMKGRLETFHDLQRRIEFEAMRAEVSARIAMYDGMEDEADLFDDIWNGLGNTAAWLVSPIVDAEWDDFENTGNFAMVKRKYRELLEQLDREGLKALEDGKRILARLNAMAIHEELQGEYEDLALSNRLSLGLAMTPVAAVGGSLFAEGAALLGAGRVGMGFANALGFTLSAKVLHGAAYHGLQGVGEAFQQVGENPIGFAEETLLNWAMFGVLGKINRAYFKFFEARVEGLVVSRLVAQGRLASGAVLSEEMLAKDAALQAAYLEESNIVNGLRTEILRRGGAFAAEAATFQAWDFLMGNYQLAKIGRFDPKLAAKAAFAPQAWLQGFAFLGALKMGNILSMGLPGFARLQMWLDERMWARQEAGSHANSRLIPTFSTVNSMEAAMAWPTPEPLQ